MPVFMEDHHAVIVRIQVVGERRAAACKQPHTDLRSDTFRRGSKRSIVGKGTELSFREDRVVSEATFPEITRLEIPGSLVESQVEVIIVRDINEVEQIRYCCRNKLARIELHRAVTKWEIECLSCVECVAVFYVGIIDRVGLVVAISIEVCIHIVARGHCPINGQPCGSQRDKSP